VRLITLIWIVHRLKDFALSISRSALLGFHVNPNFPHLHLHLLDGERTCLGKFSYWVTDNGDGKKGWGGFVTIDQVMMTLQSGGCYLQTWMNLWGCLSFCLPTKHQQNP